MLWVDACRADPWYKTRGFSSEICLRFAPRASGQVSVRGAAYGPEGLLSISSVAGTKVAKI
jgi:hypothetical protein